MSLFDKLKEMREKNSSQVQGERPECDGASAPGDDIVGRLQAIGDKKQVNPPKPAGNQPCSVCGVGFPEDKLEEHEKRCRERLSQKDQNAGNDNPGPEPPTKKSPASGTCPTCGKAFLHLSRHRCKKATPPAEPDPPKDEEAGVEPVPENAVSESKREEAEMRNGVGVGPEDGHIETEPQVPSYDLFLDCVFERNGDCDIQHFSDIIGPLAEAVARENCVDYWSVVDYGRGPGLLAAKLEGMMESKVFKSSGVILADSSTPELRACKEVLKRYARNVIQGVR